ncbi:hypothetical protein OAP18_01360 [Gammaproteobacteria bacterium]|nr:hypothetical protein [Gammaproteobacteria bacterium]
MTSYIRHTSLAFILPVVSCLSFPVFAAPGDLDTSFGVGGIVNIDFSAKEERIYSVVIDNSNRIIVAGTIFDQTTTAFDAFVARFTTSGDLDTSFGSDNDLDGILDGYAIIDLGGGDWGTDVVLDSLGRILVSGYSDQIQHGVPEPRMVTTRFLDDGSVDASYPVSIPNTSAGTSEHCWRSSTYHTANDRNDNLYAFGFKDESGILRETSALVLDSNGEATPPVATSTVAGCEYYTPTSYAEPSSGSGLVLQDSDQKPLFLIDSGNDLYIARGEATSPVPAAFDITYGITNPGMTLISHAMFSPASIIDPRNMAIDSNPSHPHYDKPVIIASVDGDFLVLRMDNTGNLDAGFNGGSGYHTVDFGNTDWGRAIGVDSLGRTVAAGMSGSSLAVTRLNRNGTLNLRFGGNGTGIKLDSLGIGSIQIWDLAINSQNDIIIVGTSAYNTDILIAKYLGQ